MESNAKKENFFDEYSSRTEHAATLETTGLEEVSTLDFYLIAKRLFDITFVILSIPVVLPWVLVFALIIKMETPGPAFFVQERVGFHGKYFKLIKLRSMGVNAEKNGAKWAEVNDPRVTRVGAFIRKTRIDELPQLFNVLKGDMSIIGPRPERPIFTAEFNKTIPGFINRVTVKPGLTGWAQINGGYDITPMEKLTLDLYYIENRSWQMDMEIILKTVRVVFTGEGAR